MGMTLDEAITHCLEVAEAEEQKYKDWKGDYSHLKKIDSCLECAKEHRQLAEWLRELKELRKITQHRVHPACSDCKYLKVAVNKPCRNCCNNYRSMFEREINADEN